jgi:hypothetical protein
MALDVFGQRAFDLGFEHPILIAQPRQHVVRFDTFDRVAGVVDFSGIDRVLFD